MFMKLNIIWFALMLGQTIFLIVSLFVSRLIQIEDDLFNMLFAYIAAGILVSLLLASQAVYKKQIQKIKDADTSEDSKLSVYQNANIIRAALMETGNLLCIVAYMLTNTQWLIVVIVAVLGLFFTQKPSRQKFKTEIGERF